MPGTTSKAVSAITAATTGDQPFTISAKTAREVTGMSWVWCLRFARKHGVEVLRVGERKQLIVFASLAAAMRRCSAEQRAAEPELSIEEEARRMLLERGWTPTRSAQ